MSKSKGLFNEFCWLEQHIERMGAESGTSVDTLFDAKLLALGLIADSEEIVIV